MRGLLNRGKSRVEPISEEEDSSTEMMRHMQEQIQQLRAANQRLTRDMEVVRNQMLSLEKREVSERQALMTKIDKIAKSLERGEVPKSQEAEEQDKAIMTATGSPMTGDLARAALVFNGGPLLDAVQTLRIFPDCKDFVDMPMKDDPEVVMEAFSKLKPDEVQDPVKLKEFVKQWFGNTGDEFEPWDLPDHKEQPPQLMSISNPEMHAWALEINKIWPTLGIKHKDVLHANPQRYSAIPRKNGMVVPGGRFREMYYWDTYWVVRGLLTCDMIETASGIVEDLCNIVTEIGFVPNGGRVYYLDRSQPPLLTAMVREIYQVTWNKEMLARFLPILEKEYSFWMSPTSGRRIELPRLGAQRERQFLNIYRSQRTNARPESYAEDMDTMKEAQALGRAPVDVFRAIASAAESGWDFTTRWLEDGTGQTEIGMAKMATIDTCHVIPVDLNAMLYDVERSLAFFHRELAGTDTDISQRFDAAAFQRASTMHSWLWMGDCYRDYRLDMGTHSAVVALSDYAVPLWAGLHGPQGFNTEVLVNALKRSGLLALCGAVTTVVDSGGRTQWDAPNAWPPMNLMLVEGLDKLSGTEALADCLCETWLRNNYITWQRTGFMHEKYDSFEPGRFGAGGEYEPQVGFGWTNGTALVLLCREPRVPHEDVNNGGFQRNVSEPRTPMRRQSKILKRQTSAAGGRPSSVGMPKPSTPSAAPPTWTGHNSEFFIG